MRNASPGPSRSYSIVAGDTPEDWSPFDPEPLGALIEAYTWIARPARVSGGEAVYSTAKYDQIAEMLRRAILRERERVEGAKAGEMAA